MEAWTIEELETIASYPRKAFEYAQYKLDQKVKDGKVTANKFQYLMAIIRNFNPEKDIVPGSVYSRPKTGPQAVYVHPQQKAEESPQDGYIKCEKHIHKLWLESGPNGKALAQDMANFFLALVTPEFAQQINAEIHVDCYCRTRPLDQIKNDAFGAMAIKNAQNVVQKKEDDHAIDTMVKLFGLENDVDETQDVQEGTSYAQFAKKTVAPQLEFDYSGTVAGDPELWE